ncbi:MAG: cytochrome b/b6 domain-containing protein [Gammaproteobacteria bacterium]|nr:cytochrome b/b6 domain-containing protein [Gammaproteobacteria bacterium]MCW8958028.1 cytochrome b/b6 domain-containing protein [Gammaproteobacteria bacterium]MCW8974056.1 cytochrome b/b6 domain-containing protein [Gammaproteobacteria bacterium]MCW8993894.1 cytochrome b/b6 domain-containing protein [Gammaproteobacteria bacterium]
MQHIEWESHRVWSSGIRWFHWINVVTVLALIGSGLVIYNGKALGIAAEGKILMKTLHVWAGYLFALNLLWRLLQAFTGNRYARWGAVLPFRRGYLSELGRYVQSLRRGEPRHYLGHNPLGRLMITLLLLLLASQAVTGLVLAGTDLYYPPLGGWIASWVAPTGVDPGTLVAGDKSMVDAAAWEAMREFRAPFIGLHVQGFFVLLAAVLLHVVGVVVGEFRERSGLVSAMITGEKKLGGRPVDRNGE